MSKRIVQILEFTPEQKKMFEEVGFKILNILKTDCKDARGAVAILSILLDGFRREYGIEGRMVYQRGSPTEPWKHLKDFEG